MSGRSASAAPDSSALDARPARAPRTPVLDVPLDRVCIVMMSAVGDAVHVLPVITALERFSPETRLTWILQPGPASLVRGHPDVDEIVLFERRLGWHAYPDIARKLRDRRFDLVLALQVYIKGGVVTKLVEAPVKLGFDRARARDLNWLFTTHRIPARPIQHVQDQYFEFLDALGIPRPQTVDGMEWKLGPWPHERAAQGKLFAPIERPVAALAIGSSDPERLWSAERWAAVADMLWEDYGLAPMLVGGRSPQELAMEARIRAAARRPIASTLGASLRELVGILDASALVVSVNTAPLHIAVALDRPVIGLLGHYNPKRTGPYRRFADLQIDAYGDPGEEYAPSLELRPGRMSRITVDDVRDRVERWRDRYAVESLARAAATRERARAAAEGSVS